MKMLMLLLLVSCASRNTEVRPPACTVEVNAISAPKASGKTFTLHSGDKSIADNDLRFKVYAEMATKALAVDGFASVNKKPEVKIFLTYGIGDAIHTTVTSSVPVYGNTTSQVNGAWGQNLGTIQTFGQKGVRTSSQQYTDYKRTIVLRAVSAKSGEPLWETVITSTGYSDDLQKLFPYMLYAGTSHFGTTVRTSHEVALDDEKASSLKPTLRVN